MSLSNAASARIVLALAFAAAVAACSGTQSGSATCNVVTLYPDVQLAYPISGATSVPDGLTVLLYNTAPGSVQGAGAVAVPIGLSVGAGSPVSTTATLLPSPLPSPTALPAFTTFSTYAVVLPTLATKTTYQVIATQYEDVCGVKTGMTEQTNIGTFTTL
jgi:hypothetical protein